MRILRGVGSRALPCGCLVGIYETYGGGIVALVDATGASCTSGHKLDAQVDVRTRPGIDQPPSTSPIMNR